MRVRYQTFEIGPYDIHVRGLRDRQEYDDLDGSDEALGVPPSMWALFGLVWRSGQVLAERMAVAPFEGLRVLEVGCGLGLSSLVLNRRAMDVTATDGHPRAGVFLAHNAQLNGDPPIPFVQGSWVGPNPDLGCFDVLIGSDLLYEAHQVVELAGFMDAHAAPSATLVLVDPGRGLMGRFARAVESRGFVQQTRESVVDGEFHGGVLTARRP